MDSGEKAIGIYSGTFDPVHKGHEAAAESYLKSPLLDELWVLLSPEPPNKRERQLTDYSHRLKMLEIAFRDQEHVFVSDLEQSLPTPSYTIQTIRHIKESYPSYTLFLCIGEDSLAGFTGWYQWRNILDECELMVARRPSAGSVPLDTDIQQKVHYVDHKPVAISSSDIRDKISRRESVGGLISGEVLAYIQKHNLYK